MKLYEGHLNGKRFIKITKGKEYRAKGDRVYQENLFFSDAYQQAKRCIQEIISINRETHEKIKAERPGIKEIVDLPDSELNDLLRGKLNNVLAFCANRGQGKTSALRSFSRELREYSHEEKDERRMRDDQLISAFWKDCRLPYFEFIGNIDPTAIAGKESILTVILSKMFSRFQQVAQSKMDASFPYEDRPWEELQRKLAQQFAQCFHDIKTLTEDGYQYDSNESDLQQIAELSDSSNLLASMYKLVHLYLSYVAPKNKESWLVIQIDDADMEIHKNYQLLEAIRKYLVFPDVLILLAADMSQLESTIEQHFMIEYSASLKAPTSMVSVETCHEMAGHYLEKAIPNSRRIFLPKLEEYNKAIWVRYEDKTQPILDSADKEQRNLLREPAYLRNIKSEIRPWDMEEQLPEIKPWDMEKQLLYFLHKKTGIVFLQEDDSLHSILPTNMRELTHFLAYWGKAEDIDSAYLNARQVYIFGEEVAAVGLSEGHEGKGRASALSVLQQWNKNLEQFQHYLLELWSASNLRENSRKLFKDFANQPKDNQHYFLLTKLPDYYSYERTILGEVRGIAVKERSAYRQEFIQVCRDRGVEIPQVDQDEDDPECKKTVSYADVMTTLSVLKGLPGAERQLKFVYAIQLYYTIELHRMLVDRLTNPFEPATPDVDLFRFMGETFFKGAKVNATNVPFAFMRVTLSREQWPELDNKNQPPTFVMPIKTLACKKVENMGSKGVEVYCFNAFYLLLSELQSFCIKGGGAAFKPHETRDAVRINNLLTVFTVMLNCDVQNKIVQMAQHQLTEGYKGETWRNEVDPWQRSLQDLYLGDGMKKIYQNIYEMTGDVQLTRWTDGSSDMWLDFPSEMRDEDRAFLPFRSMVQGNEDLLSLFMEIRLAISVHHKTIFLDAVEEILSFLIEQLGSWKNLRKQWADSSKTKLLRKSINTAYSEFLDESIEPQKGGMGQSDKNDMATQARALKGKMSQMVNLLTRFPLERVHVESGSEHWKSIVVFINGLRKADYGEMNENAFLKKCEKAQMALKSVADNEAAKQSPDTQESREEKHKELELFVQSIVNATLQAIKSGTEKQEASVPITAPTESGETQLAKKDGKS